VTPLDLLSAGPSSTVSSQPVAEQRRIARRLRARPPRLSPLGTPVAVTYEPVAGCARGLGRVA
jgi:hypothetical protein